MLTKKITKQGTSLGVVIPSSIIKMLGLKKDDVLNLTLKGDKIILKKQ